MHWMKFASLSAIALASADLCLKMAAGKISNSLGLSIYGGCAFFSGLAWLLWQKSQGVVINAQPMGVAFALGVGISFSAVTVGLYMTFGAGAPVSMASPIIRLGGLLLASLVGIAIIGEPFTWRYFIGMLFCCCGVYLIASR